MSAAMSNGMLNMAAVAGPCINLEGVVGRTHRSTDIELDPDVSNKEPVAKDAANLSKEETKSLRVKI
jgi:hypothetical protein